MRIRHFAWVLAALLAGAAPAESAPKQAEAREAWIGAWGFVPIPNPPGLTPAFSAITPTPIPLGADVPLPASANPPGPTLLDNPGNVPLVPAEGDPSNITIRQLVRVAVAGNRIRLRISNEGG